MKTIWDAVNELKGDLNNSYNGYSKSEVGVFFDKVSKRFGTSLARRLDLVMDEVSHVCSIKEFNALVTEMSLDLDVNPVNEGYYHKYLAADKDVLEPIKQKPVYTQEMYDNGELPSVGMEVSLEEDTEFFSCASGEVKQLKADDIVSVISVGKRLDNKYTVLTLMHVDAGFCVINPDYVKPMPPKVDLINGEAYQYNCDNSTHNGIYDEFKKSMYSVHSITCIEYCTNIKPLTVND